MGRGVVRSRTRGRRRDELRPTQARVRDAIFNSLAARVGGADVLDLYAGSGALGIEALHRGAASALFVEHNTRLVEALRRRLADAGVAGQSEVWHRDVLAAVRELAKMGRRFEVILLDPPYGRQLVEVTLAAVATSGILAPGGIAAAEGHWRDRPADVSGLVLRREARYGETAVWYFERAGGDGS